MQMEEQILPGSKQTIQVGQIDHHRHEPCELGQINEVADVRRECGIVRLHYEAR